MPENRYKPSPFVAYCLQQIPRLAGSRALDLACGQGRHALLLAEQGCVVTCVDLDHSCLIKAKEAARGLSHPDRVAFIELNANFALPLKSSLFDIAIIVHFTRPGLIQDTARTLRPGGALIYETFGSHGQNWLQLPAKLALEEELDVAGLRTVDARFRPAGPRGQVVTAKILAHKAKPR